MGGRTCAEQGYTNQTDVFKDLPAPVRAAYAGVTFWSKPSSAILAAAIATREERPGSTGVLPVWTLADTFGCLETDVKYHAGPNLCRARLHESDRRVQGLASTRSCSVCRC